MILTLFLNLWYLLPFDYFLCCLLRKNYLFFHITRSHSQFYISNLFNHLWLTVILSRFHSFTFYLLRRLPNPGCPYRVAGLGASLVLPPGRPVGTCQQKPLTATKQVFVGLHEKVGAHGGTILSDYCTPELAPLGLVGERLKNINTTMLLLY